MEAVNKRTLIAGEVIFRQGESSAEVYHIQSGRVGISIARGEGDVLLAELGPGAIFGEMALIIGPPRTATATALEPVVLNVIPESVFRQNTLGLPEWALSIARVLADRLKNTTSSLDRLVYEKGHSVESLEGKVPGVVNIVPHSLEIAYYPESDAQRLFLSGFLDVPGSEDLVDRVNGLRRQGISPVIVSFSNVIDVQRRALDAVVGLAKQSTEATGIIQLENVQLIADRLQKHEGLQQIIRIPETPLKRIGYGEHLVRQGEAGSEMYVVKTGSFSLYRTVRDREIVLWTAEEGDVVGEMALISGKARTASARATKSSQVYVINLEEFRKNTYQIPRWFMTIIEGLATRLRNTNKKLDDFMTGDLHPVQMSDLMSLEIFESTKVPGQARLYGALTAATLKDLKSYIAPRLKRGVRTFHFDVTQVQTLDHEALRLLVRFHRYLLNARGKLTLKGPKGMQFPMDL